MNKPYECPICHTRYNDEPMALECLGECVEQEEGLKYACPYCEEVFDSRWAAQECAAKCWIEENNIASVQVALAVRTCNCTTCTNADENMRRHYPCPHMHAVKPPEGCQHYEPDVRHFGAALATEWHQQNQGAPCQNS